MPQLRGSQRSSLRSARLIRVLECRHVEVGREGAKGVKEDDTILNEVAWVAVGKELTAPLWDLTHECAWNWGPSAAALRSASHPAIYRRGSMWGTGMAGLGMSSSTADPGRATWQSWKLVEMAATGRGGLLYPQPTACPASRHAGSCHHSHPMCASMPLQCSPPSVVHLQQATYGTSHGDVLKSQDSPLISQFRPLSGCFPQLQKAESYFNSSRSLLQPRHSSAPLCPSPLEKVLGTKYGPGKDGITSSPTCTAKSSCSYPHPSGSPKPTRFPLNQSGLCSIQAFFSNFSGK